MPQSLTLELAPRSAPLHYHVRTTTAVQVGQMKYENELLYVVEQRLLSQNEAGYVLEIEVRHQMQKADDLMSRVVADLNQASRKLVAQTDRHGNLLRLENQPDIRREWQRLRPSVREKYAAEPAVAPFLQAFEQQLAVPGALEPNLRHKGALGALLPGLYGYSFAAGVPVRTARRLAGYFHDIDLPLALTSQPAAPAPEAPAVVAAVYVATTGALDADAFEADRFRRFIRDVLDDYKFPVNLEVTCTEAHTFEQATGWLLHSTQLLQAEVPGVYHNSTTHEVLAQRPPAA